MAPSPDRSTSTRRTGRHPPTSAKKSRTAPVSTLEVYSRPGAMRDASRRWRREGKSIGLVPTMGALHRGHLSLVERARRENDRAVVSVFVNPIQFGRGEDYERYPRDAQHDSDLLARAGADCIYMPSVEEMYPPGAATRVRVAGVAEPLEGSARPGHFEGVATVVAKLFAAVEPDRAYFGQKDAQQVAVVKRMARDLDLGVEVTVSPIVREPDGLAMSSRNAYLEPADRKAAAVLSQALREAAAAYGSGERDPGVLEAILRSRIESEPLATLEYAAVVDPETFLPPGRLAVLAARFGGTRLIDNQDLSQPFESSLSE